MSDRSETDTLGRKLAELPADPGVYIFFDATERVIYVGKAVNLRSRVRSYFQPGANDGRSLFRLIVDGTADLECIVCSNELEAMLLENNLIKKHRPRYNLRLRDDKTYLSLRVTTGERWPRVQTIRHWKADGHTYFGPYASAGAVYELLRVVKKYIPLRSCSNAYFESRSRPCIEYEIGRCTAPCVGLDDEASYQQLVDQVLLLLRGRDDKLLGLLEEKMEESSSSQEFELAARYRDQIEAGQKVLEKQHVEEVPHGDCDVIGLHRHDDFVSIQVMLVREGRLISSATHTCRAFESDGPLLSAFLGQYYLGEKFIPQEVLVAVPPQEVETVERWLSEKLGRMVKVRVPLRGGKLRLLEMANRHAEVNSKTDMLRIQSRESLASSLAMHLGVDRMLRRIECYDISNIQGTLSVASKVFFEDGEADPDLYRRFRIRTVKGSNDFASMAEVLDRRFRPRENRDPLPDLVVVDGGKGQLSQAVAVIERHQLDIAVIGLAKERRRGNSSTPERVFVPGRTTPIDLPQDSRESLLLQRIRDEAHRFANSYHRELRRKSQLTSGLEEIPGIGPKRRRHLLQHFGSLKKVRGAMEKELAEVKGMNATTARAVWSFLHADEEGHVDQETLGASWFEIPDSTDREN
ncbi:MAG TPA: excinuclease ABC subunit UvrC [Planctomycetes bacterium]|nr:excinuclease ABC subunit UvrC [Planctomycetota bacterium]